MVIKKLNRKEHVKGKQTSKTQTKRNLTLDGGATSTPPVALWLLLLTPEAMSPFLDCRLTLSVKTQLKPFFQFIFIIGFNTF